MSVLATLVQSFRLIDEELEVHEGIRVARSQKPRCDPFFRAGGKALALAGARHIWPVSRRQTRTVPSENFCELLQLIYVYSVSLVVIRRREGHEVNGKGQVDQPRHSLFLSPARILYPFTSKFRQDIYFAYSDIYTKFGAERVGNG